MKKDRKSRFVHTDLYWILDEESRLEDTRYWGVFYCGQKKTVKIDPKRYQKKMWTFNDNMLKVINRRHTHLFEPKKARYMDYNCNVFVSTTSYLKGLWSDFKGLIKREVRRVKKPKTVHAANDYNMQCGISSVGAAQARAIYTNIINQANYETECNTLILSLYAQYFHIMASQIEAVTVRVLDRNNAINNKFDRNALHATVVGKDKKLDDLAHYSDYEKLYCIWNFIKHNSMSTYEKLKSKYPQLLSDAQYQQGELAFLYLKFTDKLIESILGGCEQFFLEYCNLVFGEDYEEAQWNYVEFFTEPVEEEIESFTNPLGLDMWDDID